MLFKWNPTYSSLKEAIKHWNVKEPKKNISVNGAQYFIARQKDGKLSILQTDLPLSRNDELCAKLQTLMLENVVEEAAEELPPCNQ